MVLRKKMARAKRAHESPRLDSFASLGHWRYSCGLQNLCASPQLREQGNNRRTLTTHRLACPLDGAEATAAP